MGFPWFLVRNFSRAWPFSKVLLDLQQWNQGFLEELIKQIWKKDSTEKAGSLQISSQNTCVVLSSIWQNLCSRSVRFHSSSNSAVACYENPNSFSELTKAWNPEWQDFSDFCSEILPQIFTGLAVMHQNVPTFWSPPWVSFSKKYHRVERSLRAILSRWAKSS